MLRGPREIGFGNSGAFAALSCWVEDGHTYLGTYSVYIHTYISIYWWGVDVDVDE